MASRKTPEPLEPRTYRVIVHADAGEAIHDAYLRIAVVAPVAAARWLSGMSAAIESLDLFPFRFPVAPDSERVGFELRHMVHGKRTGRYRVLYAVIGDTVHVLRVRHGAQDYLGPGDVEPPQGGAGG